VITGTGKTLAYLAPVVHHLREDERTHGVITRLKRPRACIVVPCRELAVQVLVSDTMYLNLVTVIERVGVIHVID